jgi:3-phosphoshikimate 1-carboxyvinyltransferase
MGRIIEPLRQMGARIEAENGRAPLSIRGIEGKLSPIRYETPVPSAQVKSCVLLAGLFAEGTTEVLSESRPAITPSGCSVLSAPTAEGKSVSGDAILTGCEVHIPGDISSRRSL